MNKDLDMKQRVYLKRVELFFGHAAGNIAGCIVAGVLIAVVLISSGTDSSLIIYWLIVTAVVCFLTATVEISFKKSKLDISNARSWLARRIFFGSLIGTAFGISPLFVAPGAGSVPELFLFIILFTFVAVGCIGYAVMPVYYLILDVLILAPITISFLEKYNTIHIAMFITSIIVQIVVLKKALDVSRSIIEALYTNERLKLEISERTKAEEALRESEERFKTLSDAAFEGIIITEQGSILDINRQFEEIIGYKREEIIGQDVFRMISNEYIDTVRKNIASQYSKPYEIIGLRKNGEQIVLEVNGKNLRYKGKEIRVSAVKDITRKKELEKELEKLASTDSLTGKANRRFGLLFLEQQVKMAKRNGTSLTVVFADVDGLKSVNDKHGHELGDELIQAVSEVLSKALRESDLICRLGGDEFLLIFPNCNVDKASEIWSRVSDDIKRFNSLEKPFMMSISHGFSEFHPNDDLTADELISVADNEMYKVKNTKKKTTLQVI